MIKPECLEKKWLEELKDKKNPAVDIALFERMFYAFELLGNLTKIRKDFIFKGGDADRRAGICKLKQN